MAPLTKIEQARRRELLERGLKYCPQCARILPIEKFSLMQGNKDGLQSYCKNCYAGYYYSDKESRLQWQANYGAKHKDETKQRNKNYYERNRESLCCYAREYYKRNRSSMVEQRSRYMATERGKSARQVSNRRRKARERNMIYEFTTAQWISALDYFGNVCAYCGNESSVYHQDHFIPVAAGGHLIPTNIVPACPGCNLSKKDNLPDEWVAKHEFVRPEAIRKIKEFFQTHERTC